MIFVRLLQSSSVASLMKFKILSCSLNIKLLLDDIPGSFLLLDPQSALLLDPQSALLLDPQSALLLDSQSLTSNSDTSIKGEDGRFSLPLPLPLVIRPVFSSCLPDMVTGWHSF